MCILIKMDYVTRYAEASLLQSVESKMVAETLMEIHSCFGELEKILSDLWA